MLLNSGHIASAYGTINAPQYTTVDSLLEDVSRHMAHMASSNLSRRSSRGSIGQRPGNSMAHSMRIVKPSSANSSPQRSLASARRRSVMNDGLNYRRPGPAQQSNVTGGGCEGFQNPVRSSRPVSWHPSSQLASQATTYGQEPYLGYSPSVYSGYNSPTSSLSPGCTPYNDSFPQQHQPSNISGFYQTSFENHIPAYAPTYTTGVGQAQYPQQQMYADNAGSSMYSHFDWNNFSQNGFDAVTTPPTPENFLPIPNHEPSLYVQDATTYHAPEEVDDEGEELVGLGLYDTPEKAPLADASLHHYQRALVPHIFDSEHRKQQSMGKGLKLEETWNPPAGDDEKEEEEEY